MRVVVDLQGAQSESRYRGIGRYSLGLLTAIAEIARGHEVILVLNARLPHASRQLVRHFERRIPRERIRFLSLPAPTRANSSANEWRRKAAEILRDAFIEDLQPDVVLVTSLFEGYLDDAVVSKGLSDRTAIILYDLIPHLSPAHYLTAPGQRAHYQEKLDTLRDAGLLLAISDHSRSEAIRSLGLPSAKVKTIYAGVDARFVAPRNRTPQTAARLGITGRFILYAPGGFDARKNFERLIRAYSLLPKPLREDYQLVIVSKIADAPAQELQRLAWRLGLLSSNLVLTGYVDDDALIDLYSTTDLFVFPSLHEGFGLPALEAMACGAPVIGSNTSSVPEVIGRDDAVFDPANPESIAAVMSRVLTDEALRQSLREHGLRQAQRFSWDSAARLCLAGLEELAQRTGQATNPAPAPEADLVQRIAAIPSSVKPTPADLVQVANCIAFNARPAAEPKLFLDVSVIVHEDARSGIQRVVRSLLLELLANPPFGFAVQPIYFDGARYVAANRFRARVRPEDGIAQDDEPVDFHQEDVYLALDLNAHLTENLRPVHEHLADRGVRLYFVVYDILLAEHPEWWPSGTGDVFKRWLADISQTAAGLACISEAVAEEVRAWIPRHVDGTMLPPIVRSFHLGSDLANSAPSRGLPHDAESVIRRLGSGTTFLMVGTLEPRKGHAQTLAAFESLWNQGAPFNLVIVGKQGWLVDELAARLLAHPELGKRLFWLRGISDEYLELIYRNSDCLIAASEGEGFGLPLIEAADHNIPILARDLPVFREVAGEHATYFSGKDPDVLADAIRKWLVALESGSAPGSSGLPRLTWRESALQLLGAIGMQARAE
ncbi:glycosyltransferase family 1 protein [Ramlibacter henchirensis]|uniref:Glycosyltransferase family 1 protein n=1 Tax=Ramlibacter henchirensis TaxID=204072 RepID=A0A4Z0C0V2_9BURK|nr:glycosyltransferase family 1 protein [Ramlibacter henchirensis]TFZ05163.1 glycosyltransferase family 1 protein [Ramlibacter henchirensis]